MTQNIQLPGIVISNERMPDLEKLAEGLEHRNPDLADRFLTELARARVVAGAALPADVIDIGSRVTFRDETTGRVQTIILVMPEHADIGADKVSVATPVGVALIGLSTGARFSWVARDGVRHELTVEAVATGA